MRKVVVLFLFGLSFLIYGCMSTSLFEQARTFAPEVQGTWFYVNQGVNKYNNVAPPNPAKGKIVITADTITWSGESHPGRMRGAPSFSYPASGVATQGYSTKSGMVTDGAQGVIYIKVNGSYTPWFEYIIRERSDGTRVFTELTGSTPWNYAYETDRFYVPTGQYGTDSSSNTVVSNSSSSERVFAPELNGTWVYVNQGRNKYTEPGAANPSKGKLIFTKGTITWSGEGHPGRMPGVTLDYPLAGVASKGYSRDTGMVTEGAQGVIYVQSKGDYTPWFEYIIRIRDSDGAKILTELTRSSSWNYVLEE